MNSNSNILNIYKKVIKSGDLQKNPHEIIKLVLTELSRTMKMISDDIEKKKVFVLKEGSSDLINIQKSISKNVNFTNTLICEDYYYKCKILKKIGSAKLLNSVLSKYRIRGDSLQSNKLRNFYWMWKINKDYNKFSFFKNFKSLFFISLNSLKKYGFK